MAKCYLLFVVLAACAAPTPSDATDVAFDTEGSFTFTYHPTPDTSVSDSSPFVLIASDDETMGTANNVDYDVSAGSDPDSLVINIGTDTLGDPSTTAPGQCAPQASATITIHGVVDTTSEEDLVLDENNTDIVTSYADQPPSGYPCEVYDGEYYSGPSWSPAAVSGKLAVHMLRDSAAAGSSGVYLHLVFDVTAYDAAGDTAMLASGTFLASNHVEQSPSGN